MAKRRKTFAAWKRKAEVDANARRVLPAMARDYFDAGRKVIAAETKPAELHPFRLDTKRFRYTLELFSNLYGPSMQAQLALLKPVQDALGQVNDCVATRDAFAHEPQFDAFLDRRAAKKTRDFHRVWKQQFDDEGQEEMWVEYLSRAPKLIVRLEIE